MANSQCRVRYRKLLWWMEDQGITFAALAGRLGLAPVSARMACQGETCPTKHHAMMLRLGFPADLLPEPLDKKPGPHPKTPRWPAGTCPSPEREAEAGAS